MSSSSINVSFPSKMDILFKSHCPNGLQARYKVFYGGRSAGRCLGKGTGILMYDGSIKNVENIKRGELLMGPDSKPREVISTSIGEGPLYRVKQKSGGMSFIVNDEHILSLKKSHTEYVRFRDGKYYASGRYRDQPNIVNISVKDYLKKSNKWKSHFYCYKARCIDFGGWPESLLIDPYFLGMWLGDGTSRELRLTLHQDDWQIIQYCSEYALRFGCELTMYPRRNSKAYDVGFPGKKGVVNELWAVFIRLGLNNDKHIPMQYQIAPEKDRLALLAGLIDSDGCYAKGNYEFANTNKELALGTKRLADFLGFKTSLRIKEPNGVDRKQRCYTVFIGGDTWRIPSLLPRKQIEKVERYKDWLIQRFDIEYVGIGEFYGFVLDGDHLFVLEDGTVTHNTWGVCRGALIAGAGLGPAGSMVGVPGKSHDGLRVLCVREIQDSLRQSIKRTLSDQIVLMNIAEYYEVLDESIRGRKGTIAQGTEFNFEGLRRNTSKVKSYEGIDLLIAEEAAPISEPSWKDLNPTIRGQAPYGPNKTGSEFWINFNPELESDETYKRFVVHTPENCLLVKMTYRDNPWFNPLLLPDIEADKKRSYDLYLHIWEGECRSNLEGAVLADELREATEQGRIGDFPYSRMAPVSVYFDIGHSDYTVMWFVQRTGWDFRVIDFYMNNRKHLDHYLEVLQNRNYIYDCLWLPHDARNKYLSTKMSTYEQILEKGFKDRCRIVPKLSLLDGINAMRTVFPSCYFDRSRCSEGLSGLRTWTYDIDPITKQLSSKPEHSDIADAFRYFAIASKMTHRSVNVKLPSEDGKMGPTGDFKKGFFPLGDSINNWLRN